MFDVSQLIDDVLAILKQAGIDADSGIFRDGLIVIPVNPEVTMHAYETRHYGWKVELWAQVDHPGKAIEIPEPVPASGSTDAEAIAVFIVRCLFRAGQSNRVAHPYLEKKTSPPVSGL